MGRTHRRGVAQKAAAKADASQAAFERRAAARAARSGAPAAVGDEGGKPPEEESAAGATVPMVAYASAEALAAEAELARKAAALAPAFSSAQLAARAALALPAPLSRLMECLQHGAGELAGSAACARLAAVARPVRIVMEARVGERLLDALQHTNLLLDAPEPLRQPFLALSHLESMAGSAFLFDAARELLRHIAPEAEDEEEEDSDSSDGSDSSAGGEAQETPERPPGGQQQEQEQPEASETAPEGRPEPAPAEGAPERADAAAAGEANQDDPPCITLLEIEGGVPELCEAIVNSGALPAVAREGEHRASALEEVAAQLSAFEARDEPWTASFAAAMHGWAARRLAGAPLGPRGATLNMFLYGAPNLLPRTLVAEGPQGREAAVALFCQVLERLVFPVSRSQLVLRLAPSGSPGSGPGPSAGGGGVAKAEGHDAGAPKSEPDTVGMPPLHSSSLDLWALKGQGRYFLIIFG